jgi:hypothetical protein
VATGRLGARGGRVLRSVPLMPACHGISSKYVSSPARTDLALRGPPLQQGAHQTGTALRSRAVERTLQWYLLQVVLRPPLPNV